MKAAHYATHIPVFVGDAFNRTVGTTDTGFKKYEQVEASNRNNPEVEKGQRPQLVERVPGGRENPIENTIKKIK